LAVGVFGERGEGSAGGESHTKYLRPFLCRRRSWSRDPRYKNILDIF